MIDALPSEAERRAQEALSLPALGGLNLIQTRRQVAELLRLIGTGGIFDDYTKHDISHADAMLDLSNWVIPDATKQILTPADWLLIVLSIYLHDLGMLVTKDEYQRRSESGYVQFRDQVLLTNDDDGKDYTSRINKLPSDQRERFLYQEYVRANHASRIYSWIRGDISPELGAAESIVNELRTILNPLSEVFKRDLARVCESHHLGDLYDTRKYPVLQPYGQRPGEIANVQYVAILLRTVDLLHITGDRAPSIAARAIKPVDPVGQIEWAKQESVRAVLPQIGVNKEGLPDEEAPRNVIEVYATFENEDAFFGLTSYLAYAQDELRASYDWAAESNRRHASHYDFPWRTIDTGHIEAEGFLPQTFEFSIDQAKVLDLLTGQTLYNDSGVVLRELLQNSLDAVRLQYDTAASNSGSVVIKWDSSTRVLEVWDNGTGMSQEIIENNFLRVGASRYQEPQFRKENPNFNPISRFGIGVLSAFMIADEVQVITCVKESSEARQLSLRSVHGKYLIRVTEKAQDTVAQVIGPHGTMVRLTVRPSVRQFNVVELAERWVVVPGCVVTVQVDNGEALSIGSASVAEALESELRQEGFAVDDSEDDDGKPRIRIIAHNEGGVSLAYAVIWNIYFKEWTFLSYNRSRSINYASAGTCIEGVRVEFGTPGFRSREGSFPLAICNIRGTGAPRTNVARSAIEWTSEYRSSLASIYNLYCRHVVDEIQQQQSRRHHSLTWALEEGAYLIARLSPSSGTTGLSSTPLSVAALQRALMKVPLYAIEMEGERMAFSALDLQRYDSLWSIESAFARHIESLLREIPGSLSLRHLLRGIGQYDFPLPDGPILCSPVTSGPRRDLLEQDWEIAEFHVDESQRRCDVRWAKTLREPRWESYGSLDREHKMLLRGAFADASTRLEDNLVMIPRNNISATGFNAEENAVAIGTRLYLLPGHPWEELLSRRPAEEKEPDIGITRQVMLSSLLSVVYVGQRYPNVFVDLHFDERVFVAIRRSQLPNVINLDRFAEICESRPLNVFDTRRWQQRGQYDLF